MAVRLIRLRLSKRLPTPAPVLMAKKSSLDVAIATAAVLLKDTRLPVIGGCATDVNGMRGLLALADRCGAVVDNMNSPARVIIFWRCKIPAG